MGNVRDAIILGVRQLKYGYPARLAKHTMIQKEDVLDWLYQFSREGLIEWMPSGACRITEKGRQAL